MEDLKLRQQIIDEEHLRLLSLFHYIAGGITLFVSFILLFQFLLLFVFWEGLMQQYGEYRYTISNELDATFLTIFFYLWLVILLFVVTFGILEILSGRFIKLRKRRTFSFIIAIINLLSIPYGTLLGIMTIIVLSRNSVKEIYIAANQIIQPESHPVDNRIT
jgi:succinate dehydrogenase/fumarate reductase cytochrome b subunit